MDDDQVRHAIQRIEQGMAQDDPSFAHRFHTLPRREMCSVLAVFALLATGAVLVTVGLAVPSWIAWCSGLLAFAASVAVDEHHKRARQ